MRGGKVEGRGRKLEWSGGATWDREENKLPFL
jgi:hypothetical protein